MFLRGNWKLGPLDPFLLRNIVLFGVGWQQYMGQSDVLSKLFFRKCLSRDYLHSVRDMYTYNELKDIVPNVIYTACPTLLGHHRRDLRGDLREPRPLGDLRRDLLPAECARRPARSSSG